MAHDQEPSWFLVSEHDNAISPDAERFMAQRTGASTQTIDGSHTAFIAKPVAVATFIRLVLLPGFILAGIGLGVTSTGLASAALSAVEPAHAGMAAGLVNTLRQVGTATGVAVLGALYASRVTTATLHALAGLPAPPGTAQRLAAAVASGAGTRVTAALPPAARAAVTQAAASGTASGLNDVLIVAAALAALGAVAGFAYGPDPARQPPSSPVPGDHSGLTAQPPTAQHQPQPQPQRSAGPETTAP